jgi:hypothetical protein
MALPHDSATKGTDDQMVDSIENGKYGVSSAWRFEKTKPICAGSNGRKVFCERGL